jgi:hypothetical protein
MKKLLLSVIALASFATAKAQLPAGTPAQDFTITDIYNVTHNLYTLTDSGYTVILDISATWCGPCWAVHNSHVFDSLTHHYGPNGTISPKKIKFIFVEGDATTPVSDLYGGGSSQGDWVIGTNYPIADNAALKTTYTIGGYPTFYVICPNRFISFSTAGYSQAMLQESFWVPYMQNCPVAVAGTNAANVGVLTNKEICVGGTTSLSTRVQNLGTSPLTSATIEAKVAGSTIATYNWSGNLSKYAYADVVIGNYTFPAGTTNVDYIVTTPNDVLATDNSKNQPVSGASSMYRTWTLQVKTDQYPGETTWKLKNSGGTVVDQKTYAAGPGTGGAGGADAGKIFNYYFNLNASECYTLEVTDTYGDGLYGVQNAVDTGYIKLYDDAMLVTPLVNFGAGYEYGKSSIVKTGTVVGVEDINSSSINIYPNPASTFINVNGLTGNATINIVDVLGRTVKTANYENNTNAIKIDITNLNNGNYFVKIIQDGKVSTKSITISK